MRNNLICNDCGHNNNPGESYCQQCGSNLYQNESLKSTTVLSKIPFWF